LIDDLSISGLHPGTRRTLIGEMSPHQESIMLKSIILAASLAVAGGLSLQPALAQTVRAQRSAEFGHSVESSAVSAKEPQGEHVRVNALIYQVAGTSDAGTATAGNAGNVCVTSATSDCTQATVSDSSDGLRDKNDISRHRQITGQAR
jgi:hypothetical protein